MDEILPFAAIILALVWIILHYVTRWKTSATLSNDDETMLEELYQLARRLEERMQTVERLVADQNPEFRSSHRLQESEDTAFGASKDQERTAG